jgi:hypothetical protein
MYSSPEAKYFKKEKKDNFIELVKKISEKQNENIAIKNFLDSDGRINIFSEGFSKEESGKAKKELHSIKMDVSGINRDPIKNYYIDKYNIDVNSDKTEERLIGKWDQENERKKSSQAEKIIYIILYKFLKEKFLVSRSSEYDDFKNGVDFLIIDKESGSVVGAFDGLHDDRNSASNKIKEEKILKKAKRGGAQIKFGANLDENKEIQAAKLKNVPVFYLPLKKEQFYSCQKNISSNSSIISNEEKEIFSYFFDQINRQAKLIKQEDVNNNLSENLDNFIASVKKLIY